MVTLRAGPPNVPKAAQPRQPAKSDAAATLQDDGIARRRIDVVGESEIVNLPADRQGGHAIGILGQGTVYDRLFVCREEGQEGIRLPR